MFFYLNIYKTSWFKQHSRDPLVGKVPLCHLSNANVWFKQTSIDPLVGKVPLHTLR